MKRKKIIAVILSAAAISTTAHASVSYTVQKGDSLWKISEKFNTTVQKLTNANPYISPEYLDTGTKLTIPSDTYTVQKGDTYYLIAMRCGIKLSDLLKLNGSNEYTALNIGDVINLTSSSVPGTHTVIKGDTYWSISQKYGVPVSELMKLNGADENSILYVGNTVKLPSQSSSPSASQIAEKPYITYTKHIVSSNDTLWNISIKYGIPFEELLSTNGLTESSVIYSGTVLTIPVHHIPVKSTLSSKYGELLDWFTEAQYVVPINADITIVDFTTGQSFNARRTIGSGHADCEPLTAEDTAMMKKIWGGTLNWNKRSVLVLYNGRKIAASAASAIHAGNENAPGGVWTSWRSGNYGAGQNYDYVKGNNADGHFDLYFYNSIGHSSPVTNSTHQANILKSAGLN